MTPASVVNHRQWLSSGSVTGRLCCAASWVRRQWRSSSAPQVEWYMEQRLFDGLESRSDWTKDLLGGWRVRATMNRPFQIPRIQSVISVR